MREVVTVEQPMGLFASDLYKRACEYADALELLTKADNDLFYARNYIMAHTLELFLKSFLAAKGFSKARLTSLGHDLKKLEAASSRQGLTEIEHLRILCRQAAHTNSFHDFRYPTGYILPMPNADLCWPVIAALRLTLEPVMFRARLDGRFELGFDDRSYEWSDPVKRPPRRRRTLRGRNQRKKSGFHK